MNVIYGDNWIIFLLPKGTTMVSNNKWNVLKLFSKSQVKIVFYCSVNIWENSDKLVMIILFCWYKYIEVFRGNRFTVTMVVLLWLKLAGNDNIPSPRDMIRLKRLKERVPRMLTITTKRIGWVSWQRKLNSSLFQIVQIPSLFLFPFTTLNRT